MQGEETMNIRAKFRCNSVTTQEGGQEIVTLSPVYGTSENPANKEWSKYTPSGSISMTITAEGAVKTFTPGKEYFVLFTPAEE